MWRSINNPRPKINVRTPLIINPRLKRIAVAPSTTPRSLNALSSQLNCEYEAIADSMHANAIIGASTPQTPDIFNQASRFLFIANSP